MRYIFENILSLIKGHCRHSWVIGREDIPIVAYIGDFTVKKVNSTFKKYPYRVTATVRYCNKCCKKQRSEVRDMFFGYREVWVECVLTKDQIRDKKLKKIGI